MKKNIETTGMKQAREVRRVELAIFGIGILAAVLIAIVYYPLGDRSVRVDETKPVTGEAYRTTAPDPSVSATDVVVEVPMVVATSDPAVIVEGRAGIVFEAVSSNQPTFISEAQVLEYMEQQRAAQKQ